MRVGDRFRDGRGVLWETASVDTDEMRTWVLMRMVGSSPPVRVYRHEIEATWPPLLPEPEETR